MNPPADVKPLFKHDTATLPQVQGRRSGIFRRPAKRVYSFPGEAASCLFTGSFTFPMPAVRATCLMVLAAIAITGCHSAQSPEQKQAAPAAPKHSQEVTLFAAASTQNTIAAIVHEFERLNPDVKVLASFESSAAAAEKIARGAPADVFLSASRQWADFLADKALVTEQHELLGNALVAIEPADAPWHVGRPQDLKNDDIVHIAIADPESVPAGIYAKQALVKLELWDELADKMVAGNDVRHALTMVETGAAEAGIVYSTDAAISDKVKTAFPFDRELTEPILYPLVLTRQGAKNSAATELYHFLQSSSAAVVFRQSGFRVQQKSGVQ